MNPRATSLVWRALQLACAPAWRGFFRDIHDTARRQQHLLRSILHANRDTVFGRQHGFRSIRSWRDYHAAVPIQSPVEYQLYARRIGCGEPALLSPEPPAFFGMTSGSGGEVKLIAHPPAGLAAFRLAARIWLADMLQNWPAIRNGRAYLSISPPFSGDPGRSPTGIPIGMTLPSSHFAPWSGYAMQRISVTPAQFDAGQYWVEDMHAWRRATACLTAAAGDLTLLSIAGPGFFDVLWRSIRANANGIVAAVYDGFTVPGLPTQPADPARAFELERVLNAESPDPAQLWPRLVLLSCWAHAASYSPALTLARELPKTYMQPKGLWATEAPVSIPLAGQPYPVLAVGCACYEFLDDTDSPWLAHELHEGLCYRVVVTTPGGLYRYDLGDRVRVRGFVQTAPMLEFIGRDGVLGDLAGEKLAESFVAGCLPARIGVTLLVASASRHRYLLVLDADRCDAGMARQQAALTEIALCHHWLYADRRALGLLDAVAPLRVHAPAEVIDRLFLQQGLRADGGKLLALSPFPAWERAFIAAQVN